MTWNYKNGLITLCILCIEILIAIFVRDSIIRPFFGDVLAVILLYFLVRTFFDARPVKIAIAVYLFAVLLEFLQYVDILEIFSLSDNRVLSIILGSTFDWLDIIAYTVGAYIALLIDRNINGINSPVEEPKL